MNKPKIFFCELNKYKNQKLQQHTATVMAARMNSSNVPATMTYRRLLQTYMHTPRLWACIRDDFD